MQLHLLEPDSSHPNTKALSVGPKAFSDLVSKASPTLGSFAHLIGPTVSNEM